MITILLDVISVLPGAVYSPAPVPGQLVTLGLKDALPFLLIAGMIYGVAFGIWLMDKMLSYRDRK